MNYLITDTIKASAEKFPEKAAFRFQKDTITYESLNGYAKKLASVLFEEGVKKGDRVGILLKPSLETAVAVYGIMNAGAAYVPLDPEAPAARLAFLLKDCGIKRIVSNPYETGSIENLLKEKVKPETIIGAGKDLPSVRTISWQEVLQMPEKEPSVRMLEDDLAYVMYTSGTTGVPKGIMHTHRSGLNYAKLSKRLYGVSPADILGNHSSLHFDISTFGYFTMPLAGGTTVIIPEAYKRFPASLSQLAENESLTIWYSVPLALTQMLDLGVLDKRNLESLRWVLFGGEPFPVKYLQELMKFLPNAEFSNVYGPAEVNQCTFYNFSNLPENETTIPLGRAWDNTEIIILDEHEEREVSKGETGELLVRTATMMKGYWQQPGLTEKALYKRERIPGCEEVFYRTGDLVREDENGDLVFAGRKDRQIKMRGYRIELNEIESILTSHEKISEAAVYTFRDKSNELTLAASVVLKNGSEVNPSDLREHMEKYLPRYVVLNKIKISENLPRTPAGKVDHKELETRAKEAFL